MTGQGQTVPKQGDVCFAAYTTPYGSVDIKTPPYRAEYKAEAHSVLMRRK